MKITIRPDPDCIELIRAEFEEMVIDFLKSVGIPEMDNKYWERKWKRNPIDYDKLREQILFYL